MALLVATPESGAGSASGRLPSHPCQMLFAKGLRKGSFVTSPHDVK